MRFYYMMRGLNTCVQKREDERVFSPTPSNDAPVPTRNITYGYKFLIVLALLKNDFPLEVR